MYTSLVYEDESKDKEFYLYTPEHLIQKTSEPDYSLKITTYVYLTEHNDLTDNSHWNSTLLNSNALSDNSNNCKNFVERLENTHCSEDYRPFLRKIENAMEIYEHDIEESPKINFHDYSIESLKQLIRYIPDFEKLAHTVYIDRDSGFFGITLKSSKRAKPILNLLLDRNGEVIFSFIDRKKGIIKISGRAYFNNNLEDSSEIKHLLRMIKF